MVDKLSHTVSGESQLTDLEQIMDSWERDSNIDSSELGLEALRGPQLHHKYFKMFSQARVELKKEEAILKLLRHKKADFYMNGPNEETRELGWKLPPRGKILRTEVAGYVDSDPDVTRQAHKVAMMAEAVDALESIVKEIKNRGYAIKSAIDWARFVNGA